MSASPNDFGYGGFHFSWGEHICGIFDNHAQQMEIMAGFIAMGLSLGQRCVWVGTEDSCDAIRRQLAGLGADLPTLEASGLLLIISRVGFYLHDGVFDPEHCLELLDTLLKDSRQQGYTTMRIVCDASWLRHERTDPNLWESFQLRLSQGIAELPLVMVCQATRQQFSGSLIVVALRTHPTVILGDVVRENPFYMAAASPAIGPSEIT